MAVAVKVARPPIVSRLVRSEILSETQIKVRVVLEDEGSGLPLEYGFPDRRLSGGPTDGLPPEETVWNKKGEFVVTLVDVEQSLGWS